MARFTSPDANGLPGPTGPTGPAGEDGVGVPPGGNAGDILAKIDGTDFNTEWIENYTSVVKHLVKYVGNPTIPIGTPVYTVLNGNQNSSTNIPVNIASNASEATSSKTMGLIEASVEKNGFVYVITEGLLEGINTSTANTGDPVWLGVDGTYIFGLANKPSAPAHLVFLGIVTRGQQVNGEIFVKVQNGFELNELHTVALESNGSIADNEVLAFDSASGLWKNQTASEAGVATESYVGTAISNLVGSTNQVIYKNSSNVASGSAGFTYDGTDLSVAGKLNVTASSGDEGGEIFLNKAVTNTSINGGVTIDVYRDRLRIFEQGGNARGTYLDLTKAPNGVAGELSFKSSGFVNAGVDVTLGNLKARIPTSGNRSLQLSTVTGTYSVYGSDVHSQNGVAGATIEAGFAVTVTTTPTYIVPGYHFTTSGSVDTWVLMDTSNTIAWRVTVIIGAGYSNNFISIERL
jgi:hypothetical protein